MRSAIDLFSGCGGLTCGLKDAGFDVLACAEIRPEARKTYKLNHRSTKIYEDIRDLKPRTLLRDIGLKKWQLDLLAACPPCQGFSSMRTRNRDIADDPRNELIFEVMRLVKGIRPKCVLIENVPKLLTDERLARFKAHLSLLGYRFSEGVLDAQDFGVPQRRKRMILIGCRLDICSLPKALRKSRVVGDLLLGIPKPESEHRRPLHRIFQQLSPKVMDRIKVIKKNRSELPDDMVLDCHRNYPEGFKDVYGRISWDEVSPTITRSSHNPSKGRFVHPVENRGLTLYEAMLLQGFPRKYKFPTELGIGKISSMIGEAFPPPMAAAQAKHLRRKLNAIEKSRES
jgi:DNA (cytosine-5)-methyltransferase 1